MSQQATQPNPTSSHGWVQWWFNARELPAEDNGLLHAAYQSGCSGILIRPEQQKQLKPGKQMVVYVEQPAQLEDLPKEAWIISPNEELVRKARQGGRKAGCFLEVEDLEKEFPRCDHNLQKNYDFVLIDSHHPSYIPFELLVARIDEHKLNSRILRSVPIVGLKGKVDEVNQVLNGFATLEKGVDILFRCNHAKDIKTLDEEITVRRPGKFSLVPGEVVEVRHTDMGDRVCIDTTTLMTSEEGMIVGSTGWGGIFVCSETHYLPHMNFREFRVNAGGVHSYVWGPNNVAVYLSELRAGSRVLAVDVKGNTRVVTVGRVKIERRPLLLISVRVKLEDLPQDHIARKHPELARETSGITPGDQPKVMIKSFVQNDWHVRVMGADQKVRHSTLVQPGEKLMVYADPMGPGRHTGIKVSETIAEK